MYVCMYVYINVTHLGSNPDPEHSSRKSVAYVRTEMSGLLSIVVESNGWDGGG